jgi:hypothetical protein
MPGCFRVHRYFSLAFSKTSSDITLSLASDSELLFHHEKYLYSSVPVDNLLLKNHSHIVEIERIGSTITD